MQNASLMKTTLIDSLLLKERMKHLQEEQLLSTGLSWKSDTDNSELRTVLSVVGSVSIGHYDAVKRISTSLRWIYDMLRRDYDIQKKGIHFFNLLDLNYDPAKLTPTAFSTDPMIVLRIIKFIKLSRIRAGE